jgi:predicted RND superfamily exporter protein
MQTKSFMRRIARFVLRYYILIIAVSIAAAGISFPRAMNLFANIDTDLTKLLPEHYKSVESINQIRKMFKTTKALSVIVENPDPAKAKSFAVGLAQEVEKDPSVSSAEIKKRGYEFFDKHKMFFIDLKDLWEIRDRIDRKIQREKLGGLYIDFEDEGSQSSKEFKFDDIEDKYKQKYSTGVRSAYYTNDGGTIYVIYVRPKDESDGIKGNREFYMYIKGVVEKFSAGRPDASRKIFYSDSIRTRVEEYDTLIHDLSFAGIISGIGIYLILLLYFRRVFAAALVFAPLTIGILITFAVSSFRIPSLNIVTSFLFAILGGLGVEIGIHMLSRYIEERRKPGTTAGDALFNMLYHTGGSALTSAATVATTFFVLMINDFKGFSDFGFIAGLGLVINYAIYILVFPSMLVLAEKIKILSFKRGIGFDTADGGAEAVVRPQRFPLPKFTLLGFGVLLLITLIDLPRVNFEWRFSRVKANVPSAQEAKSKQRQTSSSVNNPAAVIVHNREEAEAVKAALDESKARLGDKNVVDAFKSYYDLVPSDQPAKKVVLDEIYRLLSDHTIKLVKGERKKDIDRFKDMLKESEPVKEGEVPPKVKELFKGSVEGTGMELAYINPLPRMELDNGRNAIRFAEQIQNIKTPLGTFHPSSDAIVFADVLRTMMRDGKRMVVLAFVIVCIIVFLDFRKVSATLLIVSPIALGILYTFLIMYIFGIRLNFYNMVVIPISVGTSIDNSIHLYHRYKELGRGSIIAAMKSSGSAALTSSLTNIFGFLGLCFTFHSGLKSIGMLAVAGLVACLLTTLLFFPALLQVLEDRAVKKEAAVLCGQQAGVI